MALAKATIENCDTKVSIKCMFNPTEYSMEKSNDWRPQQVTGKNVPVMAFGGGQGSSLSLELFFDTYEEGKDVRPFIQQLWDLTLIDESTKRKQTHRARPPLCIFRWGPNWSFKAVVERLSVRYTLFQQDGTPVRATATIALKEAEDAIEQPLTNPTSHSEPGHRRREVRPHDTLALIAFEEFGSPTLWRRIADANGMDDPMALSPGQILAIPPR
jgi:hypothetical protein